MASSKEPAKVIDEKTREAFSHAFDEMSEWRDDITKSSHQHSEKVFKKLSAAARSAGWPDELIQSTKSQLMQASKFQTDMIDHILSTWEEQMRVASDAGARVTTVADKSADLTTMAMAPAQMWLQMMDMWRQNWSRAVMTWTGGSLDEAGKDHSAGKH